MLKSISKDCFLLKYVLLLLSLLYNLYDDIIFKNNKKCKLINLKYILYYFIEKEKLLILNNYVCNKKKSKKY